MTVPWKTQKEAKTYIQDLLARDALAVELALRVVYRNQTEDEQRGQGVSHRNDKGFTPGDAWFLSSLARSLEERGELSSGQLAVAREKLPKYWNQLRLHAEHKKENKDA